MITAESLPAQYRHGTYRLLSPEATLARVAPLLDACGITRCADVTQLDTLGIPVYCAIRPEATVQQISNGKGLTAVSAKVSALMEGDRAVSRRVARRRAVCQRASVRASGPGDASFSRRRTWRVSRRLTTTPRASSSSGWREPISEPAARVQVPASAVFFHRRPHLHVTTTNGLASGNHTIEASLHALYEVIERNAAAELLGHKRIPIHEKCRVLALDSIDDPDLRDDRRRIGTAESRLVVLQVDARYGRADVLGGAVERGLDDFRLDLQHRMGNTPGPRRRGQSGPSPRPPNRAPR